MFNTITSGISHLRTYLPAKESVQTINPKTLAIIGTVFAGVAALVYMASKYDASQKKVLQLKNDLQLKQSEKKKIDELIWKEREAKAQDIQTATNQAESQTKASLNPQIQDLTEKVQAKTIQLNEVNQSLARAKLALEQLQRETKGDADTISNLKAEKIKLQQTVQQTEQRFNLQIQTLTTQVREMTTQALGSNSTQEELQKKLEELQGKIMAKEEQTSEKIKQLLKENATLRHLQATTFFATPNSVATPSFRSALPLYTPFPIASQAIMPSSDAAERAKQYNSEIDSLVLMNKPNQNRDNKKSNTPTPDVLKKYRLTKN